MSKEENSQISSEIEQFESINEAYEAGKRAGMIEGYLRATESLKTTIDRLQAMFVKKVSGVKEQPENE